jgi:hypothetical protein
MTMPNKEELIGTWECEPLPKRTLEALGKAPSQLKLNRGGSFHAEIFPTHATGRKGRAMGVVGSDNDSKRVLLNRTEWCLFIHPQTRRPVGTSLPD